MDESNGFRLIHCDDDIYYERIVDHGRFQFSISLLPEEKYFSQSLVYAKVLSENIPRFLSDLSEFLSKERERFNDFESDFDHLELGHIDFINRKDPSIAEVVFKELSNGRIWGCAYKEGTFYNLGFDD